MVWPHYLLTRTLWHGMDRAMKLPNLVGPCQTMIRANGVSAGLTTFALGCAFCPRNLEHAIVQ